MISTLTQRAEQWLSPAIQQTALLFGIDMLTNVTDYGFHVYLGRVLAAGEFATVQTINALVLIIVTTFSVFQPTLAKYTAANKTPAANRYFQQFARLSGSVGAVLALACILLSRPIGAWLGVPPLTIALLGGVVMMACVRPVLAGMLQGQQRFVGFGLVRTGFAVGRFASAILLIGLFGRTAVNAVAAYIPGGILSMLIAAWFLGRGVWQRDQSVPDATLSDGLRLSTAAFLAYAAYMSLQNVDLIWVNRIFSAELAGNYATAVVLRRLLAVLPLAVTVILYPRIVAAVKANQSPDRLLRQAGLLITLPTLVLTVIYVLAGNWIVTLIFGSGYPVAASVLGRFGIAMIGFGLTTVWLNLFLATRPWLFVLLLGVMACSQLIVLNMLHWPELTTIASTTALCAWGCAIGGALIYAGWLRPRLINVNT